MATANNCNVLPTLSTQRHALFGAVGAKRTRLGRQQHQQQAARQRQRKEKFVHFSEFLLNRNPKTLQKFKPNLGNPPNRTVTSSLLQVFTDTGGDCRATRCCSMFTSYCAMLRASEASGSLARASFFSFTHFPRDNIYLVFDDQTFKLCFLASFQDDGPHVA